MPIHFIIELFSKRISFISPSVIDTHHGMRRPDHGFKHLDTIEGETSQAIFEIFGTFYSFENQALVVDIKFGRDFFFRVYPNK